MADTVVAAWITVGGTVLVAVVSVITQLLVTRFVMKSEREKIAQQVDAEHRSRALERRSEILIETLSELLSASDPQVETSFNYGRFVSLIHRAQIVLDTRVLEEAELNNTINHLGLEFQKYMPHHEKPIQERLGEYKRLLGAHAEVAKLASQVLRPQVKHA